MNRLLFIILLLSCLSATAQVSPIKRAEEASMVLKGVVLDERGRPISNVNVLGRLGRYATSNAQGQFEIPADLGDEIIIRGLGFETVYYRVRSGDDLEIRVEKVEEEEIAAPIDYQVAMDSAQFYFKSDSKKTADFLIRALSNTITPISNLQKSRAHLELSKLYIKDNQYDLAVDQANRAVNLYSDKKGKRILAKSLRLNGNYQEAIKEYRGLVDSKNSASDQIAFLSGLASSLQSTGDYDGAIKNYEQALLLARKTENSKAVTQLITDLATLNQLAGRTQEASLLFNDAIKVAQNSTPEQVLNARQNKANFLNQTSNFAEEIQLRQLNIKTLDSVSTPSSSFKIQAEQPIELTVNNVEFDVVANDTEEETSDTELTITKQSEQYKIAEAYNAQKKTEEAIEYYTSSLSEAMASNDLAITKDAAIRLSDIYRESGNDREAMKYGMIYINAADAYFRAEEKAMEETARSNEQFIQQQNRIANLETVRSLNQKQLQLALAQQALDAETTSRQRWIIYSLAALALLLLTLAYFMYRNNQQQKVNNRLLALKSLRSQMNPHFIFNALNSVNSFIALNDERSANRYLSDFSKLMRSVLENSELDLIPLQEEVKLLELYLKLEHQRFEDKFDYEVRVEDALLDSNLKVPPMLVQPIIENAIWHGLRYKEEKGFLKLIFTHKSENEIQIAVIDNGIGRERSKQLKTDHQKKRISKGMGNIQNRVALLNELKNTDIDLQIADAQFEPDTGTEVIITLKTTHSS
jgi:tetratricopeptide (TPR) repeat protein